MSPRRDGGPDRSPQLTVVSVIWGGVGVVALVVALVASSLVVGVFGLIAVVGAGLVYVAQQMRERSAIETEQTLGTGPLLSPAERSGYAGRPPDTGAAPFDEEPEPEEPSESELAEQEEQSAASDGGGSTRSVSEEDDGYGGRPGDQAGADVGAATATDPEADAETGRRPATADDSGSGRIDAGDDEAEGAADEQDDHHDDQHDGEVYDAEIVDDEPAHGHDEGRSARPSRDRDRDAAARSGNGG